MSRIAVGIIRRAHGIRGEVSVEPWTDSADRFGQLHTVTLVSPDEAETVTAEIDSSREHGGRALVKFRGIDTPEATRVLTGWTIEIPESDARKLAPDEYFLHDLAGLVLIDRKGENRGVVKGVYEGGGGLLLNVAGPKGEFEVPFAKSICTEIDLPGKRILVDLPDGIDDLAHVED